jgi:serine protease Do
MIRTVADMLRTRRRVHEGMVTVDRLHDSVDGLARQVVVEHVDSGSPASIAGLKTGDVITRIGNVPVACTYDVERAFLDRKLGDKTPLVIRRQDKDQRLELAFAVRDSMVQQASTADVIWTRLGMRLTPVALDQAAQTNKQLHGGLEVMAINSDSPAAKAGIHKGDVLVGLQQWETVHLENVTFVLNHPDLPATQPLTFYILRAGQVRRGTLQQ